METGRDPRFDPALEPKDWALLLTPQEINLAPTFDDLWERAEMMPTRETFTEIRALMPLCLAAEVARSMRAGAKK